MEKKAENQVFSSKISVENSYFKIVIFELYSVLTFRVNIAAGKFHGVIIAATPTGCRINTNSLPLVGAGTT